MKSCIKMSSSSKKGTKKLFNWGSILFYSLLSCVYAILERFLKKFCIFLDLLAKKSTILLIFKLFKFLIKLVKLLWCLVCKLWPFLFHIFIRAIKKPIILFLLLLLFIFLFLLILVKVVVVFFLLLLWLLIFLLWLFLKFLFIWQFNCNWRQQLK